MELEGSDRLSGPSETCFASGNKRVAVLGFLLAALPCPLFVVSASGQLIKSQGGEYRALANTQLSTADPALCRCFSGNQVLSSALRL